jgi:hypothetical protein
MSKYHILFLSGPLYYPPLYYPPIYVSSRNSVVGIENRLRAGRSGARIPVGAREVSLLFQTGSGANLVSNSTDTGAFGRG